MIEFPGLLIVSGTGKNSGKTTFICNLIGEHKDKHNITAVKIAPHAHHISPENEILVNNERFQIIRETSKSTGKDSSMMLRAGASEVFYIQAFDDHLRDAFKELAPYLKKDDIFICESGGLRNVVVPDLFVIIHNKNNPGMKSSAEKMIPLADCFIERTDDAWEINSILVNPRTDISAHDPNQIRE